MDEWKYQKNKDTKRERKRKLQKVKNAKNEKKKCNQKEGK